MNMLITRVRFGPGHSTCKPLPVPTQDGPNRFIKFKLRKIRRDFSNVLCFANSEKLRKTARELISNYKHINKHVKYLEYIQDYKDYDDDHQSSSEFRTEFENSESLTVDRKVNNGLIMKSKGFWIVYSKRFKDSIHLLSVSDIAKILLSFHIFNRDSGEYVVAVLELKKRISELEPRAFIDTLWVLSRRLKLNTHKEFFKLMANHVPNLLYAFNAFDIVNVLWNLNNAGYKDPEICKWVQMKFLDCMEDLDEQGLSAASLAFGRFGYRNMEIYSRIEEGISKNCNGDVLFQVCWGFFMAAIDVTKIITERTETLINSLEGSSRWKVEVWKSILNSTNCKTEVKKSVEKYL